MSVFAYDVEVNGIYYNLIEKANSAVVTSGDKSYTGDIVIPEEIKVNGETYLVERIAYSAFSSRSLLTVEVPKSVKKIDSFAFNGCSSLISVILPNSITTIEEGTFSNCSSLVSITIPSTVTTIEKWAFLGCTALAFVIISNSVKSIGYNAFRGCTSLTSVTMSKSLLSVGVDAFSGCKSLAEVHVSDIAAWCNVEFENNAANPLYYAHDFFLDEELITELDIPNSVTKIGAYSFTHASFSSVFIPNSVKDIGIGAFYQSSSLVSIEIPNSIETIKDNTFFLCSSLKEIKIPNSVTCIGGSAFYGCSSLVSVTIPNSVRKIEESAFSCCDKLASVTLGCNIPNLNSRAFSKCKDLANVYSLSLAPPDADQSLFEDSYIEHATLYVPNEALEQYKTADVWKDFGIIKTLEGDYGEETQCATPIISYMEGKLQFMSETDGANCYYSINVPDSKLEKTYAEDGKVDLTGCYNIECYARANGYTQSETATATLYWLYADGDDDANNINLVKTRGVMVTTDSDITISGLNDGEVVTFYSVNGVNLGSAKAVQGVLHFARPNESIVIAMIKGNDLKIAIR